jgi:hypothetical protein
MGCEEKWIESNDNREKSVIRETLVGWWESHDIIEVDDSRETREENRKKPEWETDNKRQSQISTKPDVALRMLFVCLFTMVLLKEPKLEREIYEKKIKCNVNKVSGFN